MVFGAQPSADKQAEVFLKTFNVPQCALADKVPKLTKKGSQCAQSQAVAQRIAYMGIINIGHAHPDLNLDIHAHASSLLKAKIEKDVHGENQIDAVGTLYQFDREWQLSFVMAKLHVTAEQLGKAAVFDKQIVQHILQFLLVASRGAKVPDACMNPEVMQGMCDLRIKRTGQKRIELVTVKATPLISPTGQVDWGVGAYEPIVLADKVTQVKHRPTGDLADVPLEENITVDWDLDLNWDDFAAVFLKGQFVKRKISDWFAPTKTGPFKVPQVKGKADEFKTIADTVVASLVAASAKTASASTTGSSSSTSIQDFEKPLKEERSAASKRAIGVLLDRKKVASAKRVVKLKRGSA
jgi:hypothetical protein